MADSRLTPTMIADQIEAWRDEITELRGRIADLSYVHRGVGEHLNCVQGLLTCGLIALYSVRETLLKAQARDAAAKSDSQ